MNMMDRNNVELLREEAKTRLMNHGEAMAQLSLGLQRAQNVVLGYGLDWKWLDEAISDMAVQLCLTPDNLMPLQAAVQYGQFKDELSKRHERGVFAEALFECFNVTPKTGALFGAFTSAPSDEKSGGTYFKANVYWSDLTTSYKLASNWGASNCWQNHEKPFVSGYNSYGSKWYNRHGQDGATRPNDVIDIIGRTGFCIQEPVYGLPAYNRDISPEEVKEKGKARTLQEYNFTKAAKEQAANTFAEWGEVYFAAFNDYRVRTYLHGSHPTPQGDDWSKGLFEFSDKKPLNETGTYWLKVALANTMGLDKEVYSVRVEAVDELLESGELITLIKGVVAGEPDSRLEEPFLFRNLAEGLLAGLSGQPVGTICHVDATASGLQLMAAALGDVQGMVGSNVIDNPSEPEERKDPYSAIFNSIAGLTDLTLDRKDMKYDCTMPWMYGGSAGVREHFGTHEHLFYQGAASEFPSAYRFLNVLKDKWAKRRTEGEFTLPDGVKVRVNRVKDIHSVIRTKLGSLHLTDKEIGWDSHQFVAHLSALIHGLDGWIVREVIRAMDAQGKPCITVHDSFATHPNDVPLLQHVYKECVCRLVQEPLLQNMIKDLFFVDFGLTSALSQPEKDEVCALIMKSKYILC